MSLVLRWFRLNLLCIAPFFVLTAIFAVYFPNGALCVLWKWVVLLQATGAKVELFMLLLSISLFCAGSMIATRSATPFRCAICRTVRRFAGWKLALKVPFADYASNSAKLDATGEQVIPLKKLPEHAADSLATGQLTRVPAP